MNVSEAVEEAIVKSKKLKEGIIRGYWKNIVEKLSDKSEPLWIKEGVLHVVVEDTMYLHHMSMNKNKYLRKVREVLKADYVKDIRFSISKVQNLKHLDFKDVKVKNEKNEKFISELKELSLEEKIYILKRKAREREQALELKGYKKCGICGMMFLGEAEACKLCSLKDVKDKVLEDKNDNE
jgi:HD superfamily phosphohydrolase